MHYRNIRRQILFHGINYEEETIDRSLNVQTKILRALEQYSRSDRVDSFATMKGLNDLSASRPNFQSSERNGTAASRIEGRFSRRRVQPVASGIECRFRTVSRHKHLCRRIYCSPRGRQGPAHKSLHVERLIMISIVATAREHCSPSHLYPTHGPLRPSWDRLLEH